MRHTIENGRNNISVSNARCVEQRTSGELLFLMNGGLCGMFTQSDMRELLPYLQAFAETGELPKPEKTPLDKLIERVNAVPRPRRLAGVRWYESDGVIRISALNHRATVLLDRSAAAATEFVGAAADARQLIDHVDAVAEIVRAHYDEVANGSTNR